MLHLLLIIRINRRIGLVGWNHYCSMLEMMNGDTDTFNDSVSRLEGFVSNREQSYEDPIEE